MITAPYFIVTKLDAFENRGRGDFQMSHDLEDIIAVIDGRPELFLELKSAASDVRHNIASRMKILLAKLKKANSDRDMRIYLFLSWVIVVASLYPYL